MTDVQSIVVRLGPNQVTYGYYKVHGDTLTMVRRDGEPVLLDEAPVTETVTPENVLAVAQMLTKRVRKALRGEMVEGFERRIEYRSEGIA